MSSEQDHAKRWQFDLGGLFRAMTLTSTFLGIVVCAVNSGGCGSKFKSVRHVEFSPGGQQLVIELASVRRNYFATHRSQSETVIEIFLLRLDDQSRIVIERSRPLNRGFDSLVSIGFARNGNEVAIAGSSGSPLRSWNVHTRKWRNDQHVCDLEGQGFWFSPSRNKVVVQKENQVQILNAETGGLICAWPNELSDYGANCSVFAQNDDIVALGYGNRVELRSAVSGDLLNSWRAKPDHSLRFCDLSRDGSKLLVRESDGLYLHDFNTDQVTKVLDEFYRVVRNQTSFSIESGSADTTRNAKFSPDGLHIIAVGEYGVKIVNVSGVEPNARLLDDECATHAIFSPNGKLLVTSDGNGDLVIWDGKTQEEIRKIVTPGNFRVPWTVPLFFLVVWGTVCWRLSRTKDN